MCSKVIAVDPGRYKCGVAMAVDGELVFFAVLKSFELVSWLKQEYCQGWILLVGSQTGSKGYLASIREAFPEGLAIRSVDERNTTLEASRRYWRLYPRKGWRRFLPASLLVPPAPIDHIAAVILLERHFQRNLLWDKER